MTVCLKCGDERQPKDAVDRECPRCGATPRCGAHTRLRY